MKQLQAWEVCAVSPYRCGQDATEGEGVHGAD